MVSKSLKSVAEKIFCGAPLYSIVKLIEGEKGIPVINIKDITDDGIKIDNLKKFSLNNFKNAEHYIVYPDDIIITCRGTQLKIAVVPDNLPKAIITSNLIAIRLTCELLPIFLAAYLKTKEGQRVLLSNIASSTMQLVLNVSNISEINVPVPAVDLQKRIANLANISEVQYRLSIESANLRKEITNQIVTDMLMNKEDYRGETD
ncbi:MAG: restriction endonuclease subunit S [bacterium]|nr:restriction endonuclease subunit S [bacterium]